MSEQVVTVRTKPNTMSGWVGNRIRTFSRKRAQEYIDKGWVEAVQPFADQSRSKKKESKKSSNSQ